MSTQPVRLQLSRRKGFDLQKHSRAVNGLTAVNCARPGKWGNPFTFENSGNVHPALRFACEILPLMNTAELRGKNLACFCKQGDYCHVDALLEFANR